MTRDTEKALQGAATPHKATKQAQRIASCESTKDQNS